MRMAGWAFVDALAPLRTEDQIVDLLMRSAPDLDREASTYWDVQESPDGDYFYVLRGWWDPRHEHEQGRQLPQVELSKSELESGAPRWFGRKKRLCIPIAEAGAPIGVWTLHGGTAPSPRDTIDLRRLSFLIGLKIHEVMQSRIASSAEHFDQDIDYADAHYYCMTQVLTEVGKKLAAFFSIDPVQGTVNKIVEVSSADLVRLQTIPADEHYRLGDGLAGHAAAGRSEALDISDYDAVRAAEPELIRPEIDAAHERVMGVPVKSMMFRRISVPGSMEMLIRVTNRSDRPLLPFTAVHKGILDRLLDPCAHVTGTRSAGKRLESIWDSTSAIVGQLGDHQVDFSTLARSLSENGFPVTLVTVWNNEGVLVDYWTNAQEFKSALRGKQGILRFSTIGTLTEPKILTTDMLPHDLREILTAAESDILYAIPTREEISERCEPEVVLALIPLSWKAEAKGPEFWALRENLLKYLGVMGKLMGTARGLARNRHLLYLAEQAIGTIGHEVRSPASGLQSTAQEIALNADSVLYHVERGEPVELWVTDTNDKGELVDVRADVAALRRWIVSRGERVGHYSHFLSKVVDNAVRWARLSGKVIEADFELLSLGELISECVRGLSEEIAEKGELWIDVSKKSADLKPVVGDPFYLHILFTNLLDNAIKYSWWPGHGHDFSVRINCATQQNVVDIEIVNWGIGIDPSDYDAIFSPFYRARIRDVKHTVRGVGLGLATCQRIARLHGGDIRVRSKPTLKDRSRRARMEGFETTFVFRLPTDIKAGRRDFNADELGW